MATSTTSRRYIDALVEELGISDTRYEQANDSYQSLGRWLNRPESTISQFTPAVYVQGSFGLGTVIKPLNLNEEYDIDAVCELKELSKTDLSQERLKMLQESARLSVQTGARTWEFDGAR